VGVATPTLVKKVSMLHLREALTFVYYGAFLLALILVFAYFKPSFLRHFWDSGIEQASIDTPEVLVHKTQLKRIKNALEVYRLEKGQYPGNLNELVSAELLTKDDLFYRRGGSYQYGLKDGKYFLKH